MHKKNHFSFLILTSNGIAWMSEGISNLVNWRDSKYDLTKTNKQPLLSEISSLRGLLNPSIINCAARNDYLSLSPQWQGYRRDYLQLLSDFQTYS